MKSIIDACLSCMGFRTEPEDNGESSHLLDQQNMQYGATGIDARNSGFDPEEQRRQREALERLCQETSERLINVAPPSTKPDMDKVAREDGPLFEEVFFKDMDEEEIMRGFQRLGNLNVAEVTKNISPNTGDQRPIVFEFGG